MPSSSADLLERRLDARDWLRPRLKRVTASILLMRNPFARLHGKAKKRKSVTLSMLWL
jgi:hypothetical protein